MDIVTLDFETFYGTGYKMGKSALTTEEYVNDPRFQKIGLSVKYNEAKAIWYTGKNIEGYIKYGLQEADLSNTAILAHNTAFDGAIVSWKYKVNPKMWLDTYSMATPLVGVTASKSLANLAKLYGLGVKGNAVVNAFNKRAEDFDQWELADYGEYGKNDAELCYALFKAMLPSFSTMELIAIDMTMRMYLSPSVVLDTNRLEEYAIELEGKKGELIDSLGIDMTREKVKKLLMSNDKLAALLKSVGLKSPPTKISPTTSKVTWAFSKDDEGFMDLLSHENKKVRQVIEARIENKSSLAGGRVQRLLGIAARQDYLPVPLNYYGAHTGRFSGGGKINMQNLPREGALREAVCAAPGYALVAGDLAQIEARMLAYVAGQHDLVQSFAAGRDVYCEFASVIFQRPITKADKTERFVGKTAMLGLGYGMGAEAFRVYLAVGKGGAIVNIDMDEADRIVKAYRNKNKQVTALWRACEEVLRLMHQGRSGNLMPRTDLFPFSSEGIGLPNGFKVKYAKLRDDPLWGYGYIGSQQAYSKYLAGDEFNWTKIYGGKVVENVVQALARVVITEQMVEIGRHYPVVLQVHDEIIVQVPEDKAEQVKAHLEEMMAVPPVWAKGLPIACEVGYGNRYSNAK